MTTELDFLDMLEPLTNEQINSINQLLNQETRNLHVKIKFTDSTSESKSLSFYTIYPFMGATQLKIPKLVNLLDAHIILHELGHCLHSCAINNFFTFDMLPKLEREKVAESYASYMFMKLGLPKMSQEYIDFRSENRRILIDYKTLKNILNLD